MSEHRRTLEISAGQASMIREERHKAQLSQERLSAMVSVIIAGHGDLPDEVAVAEIADDPPALVVVYEDGGDDGSDDN